MINECTVKCNFIKINKNNNITMWNIISGNRVLDRKRKEEAHRKHISALHNIKSQIDTASPP